MLGLAMAEFRKGDAGAAAATLDRLLAANPDFNSTEADLLAARILEAKGRLPEALSAYEPSSAASWRTSIRYPRSAAYPLARAVRQLAALLGSISLAREGIKTGDPRMDLASRAGRPADRA